MALISVSIPHIKPRIRAAAVVLSVMTRPDQNPEIKIIIIILLQNPNHHHHPLGSLVECLQIIHHFVQNRTQHHNAFGIRGGRVGIPQFHCAELMQDRDIHIHTTYLIHMNRRGWIGFKMFGGETLLLGNLPIIFTSPPSASECWVVSFIEKG